MWRLVALAIAGSAATAAAEPAVRGRVVDEVGKPIAGATILLGDRSVVTDANGSFSIEGAGTLVVTAEGYRAADVAAKPTLVVALARASDEVIELTGKAPEEAKPLTYVMTAKDIATTPGAMNDALRAITILPSAARIPFSFGGVVLRGMSPRDSSVFVDGVEIPLAFHFGGITGVFPTQALEDMRVMPSGFDVSYGRTQGGVVELTSRRPRRDAYRVGGEVSLLHSLASAEGPVGDTGGFLVTVRRSYLDILVRPLVTANDPLPSYTDALVRTVWGDAARRGELATYVFGSLDRIANSSDAARPHDPEAQGHTAANLGFVRAGATYKRQLGRSLLTIGPSVGTNILTIYTKDYPDSESTMPTVFDASRRWYQFGGRAEWLRDDPGGFVRAGIDASGGYLGRVAQHSTEQADGELPLPRNTVLWGDAAGFVEVLRHWDDKRYSIRPGLRVDRFGLGEEWTIDPRLNGHVTLSPVATLRGSLGRFHQPPSAAHFDEFADNLEAKSSYVDQATLAVEVTPAQGLSTAVTAFAHAGKQTLVDIAAQNIRPSGLDLELVFRELLEEQLGLYAYQDNIGKQRSYGLEAALRYDAPRYRMAANFSWSRAKRRYEPGWQVYGLDQPLRLNMLFATTARRWNLGARLSMASGNPVHIVPAGTVSDPEIEEPARRWERLPTFWQLDLRIDRTWNKSWGNITMFFDIQNVTNHRNVEYRDSNLRNGNIYEYEDILGLPIIPYIGAEFAPR